MRIWTESSLGLQRREVKCWAEPSVMATLIEFTWFCYRIFDDKFFKLSLQDKLFIKKTSYMFQSKLTIVALSKNTWKKLKMCKLAILILLCGIPQAHKYCNDKIVKLFGHQSAE